MTGRSDQRTPGRNPGVLSFDRHRRLAMAYVGRDRSFWCAVEEFQGWRFSVTWADHFTVRLVLM